MSRHRPCATARPIDRPAPRRHGLHALIAALFASGPWMTAWTQTQTAPDALLPDLSVDAAQPGRSTTIAGFRNARDGLEPMQSWSASAGTLQDKGMRRLQDVDKLDAALGSNYAAAGYLEALTIRGVTLDNFHNYRRDGLPLIAETRLPLDAIERVEVLQGISGIQSGQSAPGGLVNLMVKRPQGRIRQASLAMNQHGDLLTAVDLGDEFGDDANGSPHNLGVRLNLAHERLEPGWTNGQGERHLIALAVGTALTRDTQLDVEVEHNRQRQASQPGVSMTGDAVPDPARIGPDFNINSQPWSQPVRTQGDLGSVRVRQTWQGGWSGTAHYGEQHLLTDDRDVYGYASLGCLYQLAPCDRFASDGSFGVVDYRSLGERRHLRALDLHADGPWQSSWARHDLTAGLTRSLLVRDLPTATGDLVGLSNLYAPQVLTPSSAAPGNLQNSVTEGSTELYLRDHLQWDGPLQAWAGLRHTHMHRDQRLSDDSQSSSLDEAFTTPWLALGWTLTPGTMAYASWGEGIEVLPVALSKPGTLVSNSGQALPASTSRQWEFGLQGQLSAGGGEQHWAVAAFHLTHPEAGLLPDGATTWRYSRDGDSRIQGLNLRDQGQWGAYTLEGSVQWLDAVRRGAANPQANGQAPINVPDYSVRLSQRYRWDVQRGLTWQVDLIEDGPRTIDLIDGERLPAWLRCDTSVRLTQNWGLHAVVWGLSVSNAFNARAWKESPNYLQHIYLVPLASRTWMASARLTF